VSAPGLVLVADVPGACDGPRRRALIEEVLGPIGLHPADVPVLPLVPQAPPDGREPLPAELDAARPALHLALAAAAPVVVGALGGFVTKALRGGAAPIAEVHGRPEVVQLGAVRAWLLPLFHPAAALYAPGLAAALRADVARVPALLAAPPPQEEGSDPSPVPASEGSHPSDAQLGLF
jgi:uracil-DNA glycosylase